MVFFVPLVAVVLTMCIGDVGAATLAVRDSVTFTPAMLGMRTRVMMPGKCMERRGGYVRSESVMRLRGAGDAAKDEAEAEKEIGNEKYKKKEFDAALAHYEKACELDPTSMIYLNNKAAVYFAQEKFDLAAETAQKALEIGKEHRAAFTDLAKGYSRLANSLVKLGRLEDALEAFDKSLMEVKDGQVSLKKRACEKMKDDRDRAAYIDPIKAEEERAKGNELFKEGKWVEAIKAYTEGIKRDPNNHLLYSNRGQTYIKVMDFGSALKDCDKCIELKPDFPRAYARKANVQLLCKQAHKAKETVEMGMKMCPEDTAELRQVGHKVQQSIMGVNLTQEEREARAQEAMKDPQIVQIMSDPVMRDVLNEMQTDPASSQKHMSNPEIARKIETLIAAGIIQTR